MALPDRRNQRVRRAYVGVVLFAKLRAHLGLFGLHSSMRENAPDDQRQDRGDRRSVDERPSEHYQISTRVDRMPDVTIKATLGEPRMLGRSARSKKSELNARTKRQPHPPQRNQQSKRADPCGR